MHDLTKFEIEIHSNNESLVVKNNDLVMILPFPTLDAKYFGSKRFHIKVPPCND